MLFDTRTVLRLDQNTILTVPTQPTGEEGILALLRGALYFLSRTPRRLNVTTPFLTAGVEGTEFVIRHDGARALSLVGVFEGTVSVRTAVETVRLESGQAAVTGADGALRQVLTPPDAVQWAIHYDPVFAYLEGQPPGAPEQALPPALGPSYRAWRSGEPASAGRLLGAVPPPDRDARYQIFRAARLLAVGPQSAAEAEAAVTEALTLAPDSPEACAVAAVIALAVNDKAEALARAEQAVALGPESVPARLAHAYALQAHFRLRDALDTLLTLAPRSHDPLLWAQLAELYLALGASGHAVTAARQAVTFAPGSPRARVALGYTELARLDPAAATRAFDAALALDPAQPLARLGRGLAAIRRGELENGRREIEIAAILDPTDPLIRSYLGNAYAEEGRPAPAASTLDMAKRLDPADPPPWYYSAVLRQDENQPGEALRDIGRSIALNDNRAVYRGWRLIEQDRAVRGANLARIYQDLGFQELATAEATQALAVDPTSAPVHELLARSYL